MFHCLYFIGLWFRQFIVFIFWRNGAKPFEWHCKCCWFVFTFFSTSNFVFVIWRISLYQHSNNNKMAILIINCHATISFSFISISFFASIWKPTTFDDHILYDSLAFFLLLNSPFFFSSFFHLKISFYEKRKMVNSKNSKNKRQTTIERQTVRNSVVDANEIKLSNSCLHILSITNQLKPFWLFIAVAALSFCFIYIVRMISVLSPKNDANDSKACTLITVFAVVVIVLFCCRLFVYYFIYLSSQFFLLLLFNFR